MAAGWEDLSCGTPDLQFAPAPHVGISVNLEFRRRRLVLKRAVSFRIFVCPPPAVSAILRDFQRPRNGPEITSRIRFGRTRPPVSRYKTADFANNADTQGHGQRIHGHRINVI